MSHQYLLRLEGTTSVTVALSSFPRHGGACRGFSSVDVVRFGDDVTISHT